MLPKPSCSTETPQSKVLAYHQCNSYSTTDSVIPFLYKPHPEWVAAAQCCEEILHHRNAKIAERYNKYTHNFPPLLAGYTITIQSPLTHRWNVMGKIITVLPDRQYRIRVDGLGRITLRHHCSLRKCELKLTPIPILSATPGPITPTSNAPLLHPYLPTSSGNGTHTAIQPPKKPHIHHHAFDCQEFLNLCPDYYHISGEA